MGWQAELYGPCRKRKVLRAASQGGPDVRGSGTGLMDRNIEIKARARDFQHQQKLAEALADSGPQVFYQEDTFFNCSVGRLKLRTSPDGMGELIYYHRQDCVEPTESNYVRSVTSDHESLKEALSNALGVYAVVWKKRTVYVVGRTRVHLDEVEGLGGFIELEVVLRAGEVPGFGDVVARELMAKLGIQAEDLVKPAYVDLLLVAHDS